MFYVLQSWIETTTWNGNENSYVLQVHSEIGSSLIPRLPSKEERGGLGVEGRSGDKTDRKENEIYTHCM